MDIIPFIKNLLIDSLAGVSFRNLPFIVLQLIAAPLSVLLGVRLLKVKDNKGILVFWSIGLTMLFIIATTSVALSILAGFVVIAFAISNKSISGDSKWLLILFSFAAGSGHLILLLIALVIMFTFSLFQKRTKDD